eukprot:jgi/Tetstr1/444095/TSEL_003331.t1
MESDDPAVAAMYLTYAATFDPYVYVRCAPRAGCPRSGHHVFHGAPAAARAATCEFCSPPPPTAPPPGVALPASAAGVRALQRQYASAAASAAHDAALAATARSVELRCARQALENADLGTVSDAAAALPALDALHPPPAATGPEYSPPEEPPDMQRAPPSWGGNADEVRRSGEDQPRVLRRAPRLSTGHVDWWRREHIRGLDVPSWRPWVNRCLADRCHSRTAAFLASGTVSSLHKDDPAASEERGKSGEPLRVPVRPLGVGSVLVRVASAHALVQVGADAREVLGPVQHSFQSGAGRETAYISMRVSLQLFAGRGTDWLPQPHDAAVVELDPFLEAVDAANISAAFSLLGVDACDQSTPRMEAAIVQKSMPADFGGLNMALMQYEAPAALYSAQSVVMPKMSNDPRWCTPRIAATEAEQGKLAADRASSAPVQGVDRYYPFVVEDRNRLGKSALTVVYSFAVLTLLDRHGRPRPPGQKWAASLVVSRVRAAGIEKDEKDMRKRVTRGRPDAKVRKLMAASSTAQPPGVVKTLTDDKKRKRPVKKRRGKKLTVAESEAESEAQAEAEAEAARSSKRRVPRARKNKNKQ